MLDHVLSFRPGLLIAVVCGVVGAIVLYRYFLPLKQKPGDSGATDKAPIEAKSAPVSKENEDLYSTWQSALDQLSRVQAELKNDLDRMENAFEQDLEKLNQAVARFKELAKNNRLALTLFELYEGMRHFGRKTPDAQQADAAWHAKIGVDTIVVSENPFDQNGKEIHFQLNGRPYVLLGANFQLSEASFIELRLQNQSGETLATVRVRPEEGGPGISEEAVMSMKPGPWVAEILTCRVKMDARLRELQLGLKYQDLPALKERFPVDGTISPSR